MQQTKLFRDQITQPNHEFIPARDFNILFSGVFPIVPISSKTDPR
jgi:hypothetical protein